MNLLKGIWLLRNVHPEIHLFVARFKEQNGGIPGAHATYQLLHSGICPGILEVVNKHENMEQRLGNMEAVFSLYDQAIATEKGKEQSQTLPIQSSVALLMSWQEKVHLFFGSRSGKQSWSALLQLKELGNSIAFDSLELDVITSECRKVKKWIVCCKKVVELLVGGSKPLCGSL